ncbi:hypothetical protein F9278_44875 [Streptomyces phaeolivaceus]|uniref:STAS domain-containing protein n=1 Tax=Streptomyces phaeolivaceus TaxID=2653200 RepID=A0A5P8KFJ6_9ACTN|nr:hypothetical protein [Streptomyces phaeolivaceus]QFR02114.1 hypothetical protein F9278_44875 [Streptomyces phaeolivaceus]
MITRPLLTVRTATGVATVVCLSGVLDPDTCPDLARELGRYLDEAARDGQRLVLDMTDVQPFGAAVRRTLRTATEHLAHSPVLVVGANPAMRAVLEHESVVGVRLLDTLGDALAALPDTASETPPHRSGRGKASTGCHGGCRHQGENLDGRG